MSRIENKYQSIVFPVNKTITTNNPNGWYNIGDVSSSIDFCQVNSVEVDNISKILYVGGNFSSINNVPARNLAAYNITNQTWSEVGGGTDFDITKIVVDLSQNLYVAGNFSSVGDNIPISLFAKYYPTTNIWQDLSGNGLIINSPPKDLAVDLSNNVYVVLESELRVEKFLSSSNSYVTPNPFGTFLSNPLSVDIDLSNNAYIGGRFTKINSNSNLARIAKWNVVNDVSGFWTPLASGLPSGLVSSIAVDLSNNVYIGGSFTVNLDSSQNINIARWNTTNNNWLPRLSTGVNSAVNDLEVDLSNNLYVTGLFTTAGGITVNRIAKYNTTTWTDLSSGLDNFGTCVAIDGNNNVYVGGAFEAVGPSGSIPAKYIAKWYPENFLTFSNQTEYYVPNKKFFQYSPRIRLQ